MKWLALGAYKGDFTEESACLDVSLLAKSNSLVSTEKSSVNTLRVSERKRIGKKQKRFSEKKQLFIKHLVTYRVRHYKI